MQHIEFIHKDHFNYSYYRKWASEKLSLYIDFCWETDFEDLLLQHPKGFSDVLLPNIGYTYMINLGTPLKIQSEQFSCIVKSDGFIPRHQYITAHHTTGSKLFGIKFKVCPIVFEKDIDFSEYKQHIYPLAYLIDKSIVERIRNSQSFDQRVDIVFEHYKMLLNVHEGSFKYVTMVTEILNSFIKENQFYISIEKAAEKYNISTRTLQRYFEATTSFSGKQALQVLRIRKAVAHFVNSPADFNYEHYGYYDYSHFSKHLKKFLSPQYFQAFQAAYRKI
jgi:AraC-like DNA-binding protein